MLIQNMAIRFQLQTENLTSINKHVIDGVQNKHKAVVRISKVFIYVALSLCNSFKKSQRNSFLVVLEKKFTTPLLDQYKVKSGLSCPLTGPNTGQIHFFKK